MRNTHTNGRDGSGRQLWLTFAATGALLLGSAVGLANAPGSATALKPLPHAWSLNGKPLCGACHEDRTGALTTGLQSGQEQQPPVRDYSGQTYRSSSLDAQVESPSIASQRCLQCHDGTVATMKGRLNIGGNGLADDHPISFVYDRALAMKDGELHDPSAPSGLGGTIAKDLLVNGRMECTTCHDIHADPRNNPKLLRIPARLLCLTCHDK